MRGALSNLARTHSSQRAAAAHTQAAILYLSAILLDAGERTTETNEIKINTTKWNTQPMRSFFFSQSKFFFICSRSLDFDVHK